jgi:PKD repeat protein
MKRLCVLATVFLAACGSTTPSNQPPTTGSIAVTPIPAGLQTATTFTLTANGVTDPNGDTITYKWDFGDGTTATGQVTTKTYTAAGAFTVKLAVNDGHNPDVAAAQTSLTVRTLTGNWGGTVNCSTCSPTSRTVSLALTQAGLSLSGTCADSHNGGAFAAITVQTFNIDTSTGLFNFTGSCGAGLEFFGMKYDPSADTFAVSNWDSPPYTGTLTRK